MIPIKLEIEGFLAYKNKVVIDFSGFNCAVIVGDNGAGKSSILDAILYALYGKARNADKDDLINELSSIAKISFYFSVSGEKYRIYREKERGKSSKSLFFKIDSKTGKEIPASDRKIREVDDLVKKTIGLTYDAFTSSVLLVQGKSDEFLTSTPKDRKDILSEILGLKVYEKIYKKSNSILNEIKVKITELNNRISPLLEINPKQLKEIENRIDAINKDILKEEQSLEELNQIINLNKEKDRLGLEKSELERKLENYSQILLNGESIKENYRIYSDSQRIYSYRVMEKVLSEELIKSEKSIDEYELNLIKRKKSLEDYPLYLEEKEIIQNELITEIEKLDLQVKEESAEIKYLEKKFKELSLLEGKDSCPLCGREILPSSLKNFENEKKKVEERLLNLREILSKNTDELLIKKNKQKEINKVIQELKINENNLKLEIENIAKYLTNIKNEIESKKIKLSEIQREIENEKRIGNCMVDKNIADIKKVIDDAIKIKNEYDNFVTATQEIDILKGQIKMKEEEHRRINDEIIAKGMNNLTTEEMKEIKKEKEILINDLRREIANYHREYGIIEEKLLQKASLTEEIEKLKRDESLYSLISEAFSGKNLQTTVVKNALIEIGRHSDELIRNLSHNKLSLALEHTSSLDTLEIYIKELSTQEKRKYDLLSGGEKFRVSLSIALGIGRYVSSQTYKTIESIFIDEGFGALDRMGREAMIEVIRSLLSEIKMILVVTHLEDLAEAFPVQIKVFKKNIDESAIELVV